MISRIEARVVPVVAYLLLAIILVTGGILGAWMLDRRPPFSNFSLRTIDVQPSEATVEWRYDVLRTDCTGVARRVLVDGVETLLPPSSFDLGDFKLGARVVAAQVPVPAFLGSIYRAGTLRYQVTFSAYCNPLHQIWPITVRAPEVPLRMAP